MNIKERFYCILKECQNAGESGLTIEPEFVQKWHEISVDISNYSRNNPKVYTGPPTSDIGTPAKIAWVDKKGCKMFIHEGLNIEELVIWFKPEITMSMLFMKGFLYEGDMIEVPADWFKISSLRAYCSSNFRKKYKIKHGGASIFIFESDGHKETIRDLINKALDEGSCEINSHSEKSVMFNVYIQKAPLKIVDGLLMRLDVYYFEKIKQLEVRVDKKMIENTAMQYGWHRNEPPADV